MRLHSGLFFLFLLGLCAPAQAQTAQMQQIHALYFGEFGLRDNDSVHTVVVPDDGTPYTADSEFVFNPSDPPRRGEYELSGLPAGTDIYGEIGLSASMTVGALGAGTPLNVSLLTVSATDTNRLIIDGSGEGTIYIGGTMSTTGDSGSYGGGLYAAPYDFTLIWD